MRLVIQEYLSGLRERNELDAVLPDLLTQMGLEVFSKPSIGTRQYGVDVAAFGSINGGEEKVYLFTIKAGDLGRADWDSGSTQDVRPSIIEIIEVYIPTHIPQQYKGYPIEICICYGGTLKEEVAQNITMFEARYQTNELNFLRWGGEKLSQLIEEFLLREELLIDKSRSLLNKSIAMVEEPDVSYKYFVELINELLSEHNDTREPVKVRQAYLSLWIMYSWCRSADNLESAFLSSEYLLLRLWDFCKPYLDKNNKISRQIIFTMSSVQYLYTQISHDYVDKVIVPYVMERYALSNATSPFTSIDVNLKLFDMLGRLGAATIWTYWCKHKFEVNEEDRESINKLEDKFSQYCNAIKLLINNNPALLSPLKDSQAIDVMLAVMALSYKEGNTQNISYWLNDMLNQIDFLFTFKGEYPCIKESYHELLKHPLSSNEYLEDATGGSILYPYIALVSAFFKDQVNYNMVQQIKSKHLNHCNFQIWFPSEDSEMHYYTGAENHGAVLSHVPIDSSPEDFLEILLKESKEKIESFESLSAIKTGNWPILLVASRHFRIPVPINFWISAIKLEE